MMSEEKPTTIPPASERRPLAPLALVRAQLEQAVETLTQGLTRDLVDLSTLDDPSKRQRAVLVALQRARLVDQAVSEALSLLEYGDVPATDRGSIFVEELGEGVRRVA